MEDDSFLKILVPHYSLPVFLYREHFLLGIWYGELGFDVHNQACTEVDAAIPQGAGKKTARVRLRL